MNMIWRVALAGTVLAVLGGFFVGRVVADPAPLPGVRGPVNVGPSAQPTPSGDPTTLRPRRVGSPGDERTRPGGRVRPTAEDEDNSGPGDGDDDGSKGRGRGRGRSGEGDDDDVRTIGPSPRVIDDDDGGDDGEDDDGGGDDDSGGDD